MQLGSTIGAPSVPSGNVGIGFSISLIDKFTNPARNVQQQFGNLSATVDKHTALIGRRMDTMASAFGIAAGGGAALASLTFPLRQAAAFQDELLGIFNLVDDKSLKAQNQIRGMILELSKGPFDPMQTANAFRSALASGIEEPLRAKVLVETALGSAVAGRAGVEDTSGLLLNISNSYGYGALNDADYAEKIKAAADMSFKAASAGRFSNTQMSDFTALARYTPRAVSLGGSLGVPIQEVLGMLSTGSLTGLDGESVTTHLSQSLSDVLNAGLRNRRRIEPFLNFAAGEGHNLVGEGGAADLSGFIKQQQSIMPLLKLVKDYAGGDLNKLRDVFGSQYGSTVMGNLLGSQYDKLLSNIKAIEGSAGSVQSAYDLAMTSLTNRLKQLGSTFMRLKIIIGESLLDPASSATGILNRLGLGVEFVAQRLGWMLDPLLRFAAVTGIFTVLTGLTVAASSGLGVLSSQLALSAAQGGILAKLLGGSLSKAIWRVTWLSAGLIAAQELLGVAWRRDFLGLRTITLQWWQTASTVFGGVGELFKNLNWSTGMTEMSNSTRKSLEAMGLYDFTVTLGMVLYRAGTFLRSFDSAFRETFQTYGTLLKGATDGALEFLRAANVLPKVQRWLENLIDPTQDNVDAWRAMGSVFGRVAALATGLGVVGGLAVATATLGRASWFAVGGIRGLVLAASPLLLLFGGLAAAGLLLKTVFDRNMFGFADVLRERAPHLANFLSDLRGNLSRLADVYRQEGLGTALSKLTYDLSGLYPAEVWSATQNRLTKLATAISSFPHDANTRGLSAAFRAALGTVFGVDETAALYARVANLKAELPSMWLEVLGGITTRTQTFMEQHGWASYWGEARALFTQYTGTILSRWQQVTNGFKTAWADLKVKMTFTQFWRSGMQALEIATVLGAAVWNAFTTTVGAAWDALMNRVDWSAISHLISSISTSLNKVDENGNLSRLFGWLATTTFDSLAAGLNTVVYGLQVVHDLLSATGKVLSGQGFSGFSTFAASFGRLWQQVSQNPLGLAAAAGGVLLLRRRFSGLFGVVGSVLNVVGRLGGMILNFAKTTLLRVVVPALGVIGRVLLGVFAANPIGLAIGVVSGIIFGGITAWHADFLGFKSFVTNVWSGIKDGFVAAWQGIFAWWESTGRAKFGEITGGVGAFLNRGFGFEQRTNTPLKLFEERGFGTAPPTPKMPVTITQPNVPTSAGGAYMPPSETPNVTVSGLNPQLSAALRDLTANKLAEARGEYSQGGQTVTTGESGSIAIQLQQILNQLQKNDPKNTRLSVQIEGKEVAKAVGNANRGKRQLGGSGY